MQRESIKDWFHYSHSSRNAAVLLISLIVLSIAGQYAWPYLFPKQVVDISKEKEEIKNWLAQSTTDSLNQVNAEHEFIADNSSLGLEFFSFDPNSLSEKEWNQLGLSNKQAKSILNYLSKGGVFRKKSDLKKMYVVSQELFDKWYPYILLPDSISIRADWKSEDKVFHVDSSLVKQTHFLSIELNSADTIQLQKLKGIGPFYARKIIEYKEILGGYYSVDQLKELWKMLPETIDSIRKNIVVDIGLVSTIDINTCQYDKLNKHPYISSSQANSIIAYRQKHGEYHSIEEIKKSLLIDDITYQKIKPYLTIDTTH